MSKGSIKPQIPLIDFSSFISPNASPSDRLTVATELVSACHTAGFAYIKNHGLSPSLLKDTFEVAKQFYDLPQNKKMQIKIPEDSKSLHGYSWPGREKASKQNNESYEGKEDMEDVMALNVRYEKVRCIE
jgi:isopenicillin N synthase-like dioxygenase